MKPQQVELKQAHNSEQQQFERTNSNSEFQSISTCTPPECLQEMIAPLHCEKTSINHDTLLAISVALLLDDLVRVLVGSLSQS